MYFSPNCLHLHGQHRFDRMTYYLDLLTKTYKAQVLINPYNGEGYLVRARFNASGEWVEAQSKHLVIALYEVCNRLWELRQGLPQPGKP